MFSFPKKNTTPKPKNDETIETPTCKTIINEKGDKTYKKKTIVNGLLVIQNCCPPNEQMNKNENGTFTCVKPPIQPQIILKKKNKTR